MIDFDQNECNSIKSIGVRGKTTIDVTSKCNKGKKLMFAKISRKSFANKLIDDFCFTAEEVYDQHNFIKCHIYLNLTDTNSRSMFFNFICKKRM